MPESEEASPRSPSTAIGAFFKRIRTRSKSPAAKGRNGIVAAREQHSNGSIRSALERKRSSETGGRTPRTPSKSRIRQWLGGSPKTPPAEDPGLGVASGSRIPELRSQAQRGALSEEDLVSKSLASQIHSGHSNGSAIDSKARTATMPLAMLSSYYSQDSVFVEVAQKARVPSYIRVSCALNGYPRPFRGLDAADRPPLPKSIVERRLDAFTSPRSTEERAARDPLLETPPSVSVKDRVGAITNGHSEASPKAAEPPKLPARRPAMSPPPVPSATAAFPPPPPAISNGSLVDEVLAEVERNGATETTLDAEAQRRRADEARERLRLLTVEGDGYLQLPMSDESQNLVRLAYGKANLLMGKKFSKFYDLIEKNLNPIPDDPQPTLLGDLEGYWSIVEMEMEDIDDAFATVHRLKALDWDASRLPSKPSPSSVGSKSSTPSPKPPNGVPKRTSPKSTPATGKGRQNDARKRLAEAKAAAKKKMADATGDTDQIFA